ncbi:phospholipid-transporting ATPase ABCA3-like [Haemaphysalis longicornis]
MDVAARDNEAVPGSPSPADRDHRMTMSLVAPARKIQVTTSRDEPCPDKPKMNSPALPSDVGGSSLGNFSDTELRSGRHIGLQTLSSNKSNDTDSTRHHCVAARRFWCEDWPSQFGRVEHALAHEDVKEEEKRLELEHGSGGSADERMRTGGGPAVPVGKFEYEWFEAWESGPANACGIRRRWVGLIVGVVAIFFGASFVGMAEVTSLSHYILAMRESKLLCGVLPHTGFYSVLRILFVARDYGGGEAGWSLVSTKVLEKDNVTILEIWGVMLVVDVVMLFMAWYLPKVLPWASSNPQSPIFCLKPSYWISSEGAAQVTKSAPVVMDPARFEEGPPGAEPIVEVNNVTKVYNGIPALNGLSVKLYQSRVTVLLGHNGAGKTTLLNILTGVTGATSGIARVLGYDSTTQRDKIRTLVSYCQQTDIFFENLTCCENLLYFGSLKGTSWAALQATISETLKVVHLEDKAYCMPDTLSGGMKRRLSLAIAIVSKPKLVILDEPTTGLDAETRRNVWDVVQAVRKEHSVLLSSHDMEEADAIGDSIIVMARGKAVCSGSISFLKKACGVGYKITLAKVPQKFNVKDVLALIHKTVPGAEVDNDKTGEVIIALNTLNHENFPGMFKALEHDSVGLGIEAIGVTAATMKDVYLKINLDWTPGGKERETAVDERAIEELCKMVVKNPTACRRFWALFTKRLIYVTRSWSFLFVGILIPLALQLYIATSTKMPTANQWSAGDKVVINGTFPIEVRLGSHFPDSVVYLQDSTATNASQGFRLLVESEGCRVRVVKDLNKALEEIALEDFGHYMRTHPMAAAFKKNEARGLANPTSMMALPITFNMLHTALLRQLTGKPAVRITATLTYLKIENFIVQMFEYVFSFLKVMIYWSLMPALSYSLAFSAFATFPVAERLGRAREVQLMTGVSGWLFVLAHLVFDYLCYMLIMVPWCLIHYCFNKYSQTMAGAFIVTVSVFGPSVIMFCYLMAERALTPGGAMASVILWFFGGGFVLQYIVPIVPIPFSSKLFYLVPPYALLLCFVTITQWEAKTQVCSAGSGIGSLLPCDELSLYGFSSSGIGDVLLATAVGAVLLYIYMSVRLCGYFESNADQIAGSEEQQVDDDVEEETKLVNQLCSSKQFGDYALVAWKLQKRFGDLHAVRGFYLALRRSECFGLLGVNGAGKTTTFEILAGLSKATFGEAYTENATLSGRKTEARNRDLIVRYADSQALSHSLPWQPQISYCFQSGGLLDKLTGYEYLYLIGRLRGIPESELKGKVDSVLSIADLTPHADKQSGVYSGGNQRKLCISAALLGLPPIVFLDEPYAGVDVVSRTKIFHAVGRVKARNRTAFVLSSHNIDECEISCDRLTIMVQGQMMCLGTVQHLREKYGKGYRLHAMLKHGAASDAGAEAKRFVEAVPKQFPGIKLTDQHENMFSYHLAERIPWSELFTKVQALEKDFALEYAIAGDNTVEQIFIAFAKAGGALRQIP